MLPARVALNNGIHPAPQKRTSTMRNLAIAATIVVGGGFVAYQVYSSEYLIRQRKKIEKVIDAFSGLSDAVSTGGDVAVTVVQDLQKFLQSDTDEVPRSIRQLIKLGSSPGVCEAVASLASAVTVGIVGGVGGSDLGAAGPSAIAGSEAQRIANGETPPTEGVEAERSSGGEIARRPAAGESSSVPGGGIVEAVMDKMFSERGKGFASEVVGSVARNLVATYIDRMQAAGRGGSEDSAWMQEVLDLACSHKGKSFVTDCIATFVGHATTIYLDKTSGVNFYDDLVSSVTKETTKEPLKDVLASVCNGAVETFVRTSHEVMTSGGQAPREEDDSAAGFSCDSPLGESSMRVHPRAATPVVGDRPPPLEHPGEEIIRNSDTCDKTNVATNGIEHAAGQAEALLRGLPVSDLSTTTMGRAAQFAAPSGSGGFSLAPLSSPLCSVPRQPPGGAGWVNEVVKMMAVPDNRQLLTDVVGTMSAQATRAFVGACLDTLRTGQGKPWRLKQAVEHEDDEQVPTGAEWNLNAAGRAARMMAGKALIASTVCLAMCLHVLGGPHYMGTN